MTVANQDAGPIRFEGAFIGVLLSGGALAGMAQMAIVPALPELAARYADAGDGTFIAQQVMTVAGPALAVGGPLLGWLAGMVGKRNVLLVSSLLYAITGIAGAFAPDFWTLILSRILLGLVCGGVAASGMALLADYYSGERRDRLIGWVSVLGGGATLVSLIAAGVLTENFGWRAPFGLYLVGLAMFAVALPVVPRREIAGTAMHGGGGGSVRAATGYLVMVMILSIVMNMIAVQGIFLMHSEGITSPTVQSIVLDMTTVGTMAGAYAFAYLRPRMGYATMLALIWALFGIGVAGFALVQGVVAVSFFALVSGLGAGLVTPLHQSAVLAVVPPSANAKAMGLTLGGIFLGLVLNPFVIQPLRTAFGLQTAFTAIGLAAFVGCVAALFWRMRGGKRAPLPAQ
jgi:MFS family permease